MSSASGAINFKQAAQVAAFAVAYEVLSPVNFTSTICTLAIGEIGCIGIDLACKTKKWVKEAQLLHQDLQQLLDDAPDYRKYLALEPFLPAEDCRTQIASFLPDNGEISFQGSIVLPSELLERIFSHMTFEQLARFSKVSKSCYVATKTDSVWLCQLKKLFPELTCIPWKECGFTPEQQFKIVYRRTETLLNEFKWMYIQNAELVDKLYNHSKLLSTAENVYQETVYECYSNRLRELVGDHYVGTDGSIDGLSSQGLILTCIKAVKKDRRAFAIPERFEVYIRQATKTRVTQNRLKDFPQRVRKMQMIADQDIFTDMFISATIERRYLSKVLACTDAILSKTMETTFGLINPNIKSSAKMHLDKMLEYKALSHSDEALIHYSKFIDV
jgi:hypothetical protein